MLPWRQSWHVFALARLPCRESPERERKGLHARIEKLDLELTISDGLRLPDQLIHPLLGDRAVALVVDVDSVSSARRFPIDEHAKAHGSPWHSRPHDEMEIAGVKAVRDPPVGFVEHGRRFPYRPIAQQGPAIEFQSCGGGVDARLVQYRAAWRGKVLAAVVADIIFRGLQVAPIGGSFRTAGIDGNQIVTDATVSGLGQQLLNDSLRLFVFTLAELMMPDAPLRIDDIKGRPVFILESAPYGKVAIDRDRIIDSHVLGGSANVVDVLLECELRGVHADHDQTLFLVFVGPRADVGEGA